MSVLAIGFLVCYYFIYYFTVNSFKCNGKIWNLKYLININMLVLTIYPEFPDLVIIIGKIKFKFRILLAELVILYNQKKNRYPSLCI